MESVSIKELWMLLGEKDVQIYQLLKTNEVLTQEMEAMRAAYSLANRTDPKTSEPSGVDPVKDQRPEGS